MADSSGSVKIIAIVCNWCSYAGADGAGTARLKQPYDFRVMRVPCTGRVDPLLALKAFEKGADGVLISGCHPGDCHYSEGNYYARRKFELLKRMLPHLGHRPERYSYTWGVRIGRRAGAESDHGLRDEGRRARRRAEGGRCEPGGERAPGTDSRVGPAGAHTRARSTISSAGRPAIIASEVIPAFIRTVDEVDTLLWNPLCQHNLTTFLKRKMPDPPDARIGVCVKGCDSRTLVALLQESLVDPERLYVIGVPCDGVIDRRRVERAFSDEVVDIAFEGDRVVATTRGGGKGEFARAELLLDQVCLVRLPQSPLLRTTGRRASSAAEGTTAIPGAGGVRGPQRRGEGSCCWRTRSPVYSLLRSIHVCPV